MPDPTPISPSPTRRPPDDRPPAPTLAVRDPSPSDLVDWALLRDWAGWIGRAPGRNPRLAAAAAAATFLLAAASLWLLPWTWRAEVEILAVRNLVMPALGNPRRAVPMAADAPTRAAQQTIMGRDNLVALVRQADLVEHWSRSRAPLLRLKDRVLEAFVAIDDQDRVDALVAVLEKKLQVKTDEDTVQITIDWPDPQSAFQVADLARQNFLEARHAEEVTAIAETISILEGHADTVGAEINGLLDHFRAPARPAPRAARPAAAAPVPAPPIRPAASAAELQQLEALLAAKRSARAELEQFRARRTAELQTRLAELRASFASAHPEVVAVERSLDALRRDSVQVTALKAEEQALEDEFRARAGHAPGERPPPAALARAAPIAIPAELASDPETEYTKTKLKMRVDEHHDLLQRIDAARIELDTARAGFKYRYKVVKPAQLPRKPESPTPWLTLLVGAFLAVLSAFGVTAAADLWRGRVVEPWQVERAVGVPVLGRARLGEAAEAAGPATVEPKGEA